MTMNESENNPMANDKMRDVYLSLASRVCEGLTPSHYDKYVSWYFEKPRDFRISPIHFIMAVSGLNREKAIKRIAPWHMEHGQRVDDEYEKIKI